MEEGERKKGGVKRNRGTERRFLVLNCTNIKKMWA
jgi:hypothetical protein